MSYFITGATGFIGKQLVQNLLQHRSGNIYVLVRPGSMHKIDAFKQTLSQGAERVIAVAGDLTQPQLGVAEEQIAELRGQIEHFYHLAAIYDLKAPAEPQIAVNVDGTRHTLDLAAALDAGCFHHVSSIAAAGLFQGIFREDMFEEAENLMHPYFMTKHDSEKLVREECSVPFRIYRPGIVVGHSETGEIDKIDGPYYFFKMIQKFRQTLPQWMPTLGIEGGYINVVPVDFVVNALVHISHKDDLNGGCFHLTDAKPYKIGEMLNIFCKAGHAPQMALRIDAAMFSFIPSYIRSLLSNLPPMRRIVDTVLHDLQIPREVLDLVKYPTRFDNRATLKALADSDIKCPDLKDYAPALWDYWERNLDPDLFVAQTLEDRVQDKVIMITGGSSGIGLATALHLADKGAKILLVARDPEKLEAAKAEVEAAGGNVWAYSCNLASIEAIDELVEKVIAEHENVDILLNNAGRSIRRSISNSYDRFHDFERTMQLNYFGSLRLTMALLPRMEARRQGHIINISSIGVLTNAPRFSAYVASKAALDAFTRCAAAEFADRGIRFTTVNMPLVKTPMIAPTKIYDFFPTLTPEQAAEMVGEAIIKRPKRIASRLGVFIQVLYSLAPKITETVFNFSFRMFEDSSASKGDREALAQARKGEASSEQVALSHFMRGIHL